MLELIQGSLHYILSGALVGLLVGLTGVGGGSLMTPILTLIFGVAPTTAVGTDLAFAALTKGFGTAAHRLHGHVKSWPKNSNRTSRWCYWRFGNYFFHWRRGNWRDPDTDALPPPEKR